MMDLAESPALGDGYKYNPAALGLGADQSSSYSLSSWRDFNTPSLLGGSPR